MGRQVTRATVDPAELEVILSPRSLLVAERAVGDGAFDVEEGAVRHYRRTVEVAPLPDGRADVTQTVEYRLAVPYWGFIFSPLFGRTARRLGPEPAAPPWWAPPQRLDARAATVLGVLCAAAVVTGYLNTLLSQTITFASDEFGAGEGAQGVSGFAVRLGGMAAFAVVGLADRRGRRPVVLWALLLGSLVSASGALAPSLAWLTGSQVVARALASALIPLIGIVAAEEMPAGARAYGVSLLALAGGLGAGFCVMALPLADLGPSGWRLVYLLPLAGLVLVRDLGRRLPESRRFARPHAEVGLPGHGRRFWLLAASLFLSNLFVAPASFFSNRYLDNERDFSAGMITLFTLATATPASIGILAGGRLADVHGRRLVGAVGTAVGTVAAVMFFLTAGWPLWAWTLVGGIISGATVPALGVYGPELFPTSLRGRANGLIVTCALAGSGTGLLVAGFASDAAGRFGPVMAALAVGPLLMALLVLVAYPETAHRELEDLNPEDRAPPG